MFHFPSFQIATNLLSSSNNPINNSNNIDNIQDTAQIKASYYREKAKVKNTENLLKVGPQKFISTIKMKNGNEYKATSVKQSVDILNRYLLHLSPILQINLHDKYMFSDLYNVLHGKLRSVAINSQQIQRILQHSKITPESLLYHVFFHLSIILAMRKGEHYQLKINQFKSYENGGLKFFCYISKNNQRRIQDGQAHIILIPVDNNGLCSDIQLYLSKHPPLDDENFYLQLNNTSWLETNIWYKTNHVEKNKLNNFMKKIGRKMQIDIPIELLFNYSGHKTTTQILQD
ncbi:hypothetical protein RhiirA4_482629 [Rhizophagus irregularis]|uniref:Uncharacterized protein n=1 Tax=Rhizophagus irregularis TaxID=588596 RepID=A0A2I1HLC1_9GLOM|nr:hypothetical protein RhiirA4_482629 [Rhizophagus irregularis]